MNESEKKMSSLSASEMVIIPFQPREFKIDLSQSALDFVDFQNKKSSSFEINPLVAEQTGISKFKEDQITAEVEQKTLELMQGLQEKAYREGYELGLEEGSKKAFAENHDRLMSSFESLNELLEKMVALRSQLLRDHEGEIIHLVFEIAKKLIFREINDDSALVKDLLINLVEGMDLDGRIQVRLAPQNFQFIEELKQRGDKRLVQLERLTLESDEQIQPGGCVIETNYGSIDASIEQRLQTAWELVMAKRPSKNEQAEHIRHKSDQEDSE